MMHRPVRKASQSGLPPGALVHVGPERTAPVKLQLIEYDEQRLEEQEAATVEACLHFFETSSHTWLNVTGVHQMDIIEKIGVMSGGRLKILAQGPRTPESESAAWAAFYAHMANLGNPVPAAPAAAPGPTDATATTRWPSC